MHESFLCPGAADVSAFQRGNGQFPPQLARRLLPLPRRILPKLRFPFRINLGVSPPHKSPTPRPLRPKFKNFPANAGTNSNLRRRFIRFRSFAFPRGILTVQSVRDTSKRPEPVTDNRSENSAFFERRPDERVRLRPRRGVNGLCGLTTANVALIAVC